MEKGIVYVASSLVIVIVAFIGYLAINNQIARSCGIKLVRVEGPVQVVTPTVAPTATPSAVLRGVRIGTPAAVTK